MSIQKDNQLLSHNLYQVCFKKVWLLNKISGRILERGGIRFKKNIFILGRYSQSLRSFFIPFLFFRFSKF